MCRNSWSRRKGRPNHAPAPNRRLCFPFGGAVGFDHHPFAQLAASAAVGEARRSASCHAAYENIRPLEHTIGPRIRGTWGQALRTPLVPVIVCFTDAAAGQRCDGSTCWAQYQPAPLAAGG